MPKSESPMLCGPIRPQILRIALPSTAGMIASSLCTLFDALLLSRNSAQLAAAVSLSFPLLTALQTIGFTLGMGAGSFVSRCLGDGRRADAFPAASAALFLSLGLSIALCAAGFLQSDPLVRLLGADDSHAAQAARFARYVLASGPLLCASLVLSSLLRGQGKTLPGMAAYLLGAAVSIPLELLLVVRLSLGVTGAGMAMLAREAIALLVLIAAFFRDRSLIRPRLRALSLRRAVLQNIMRSGLPTLVRQGLTSLSSILLTWTGAALGEAALSGMGLAVRAGALVSSAIIGFGQGFQPFCGINFGAGRLDRVLSAYRFCLRCVCCFLAVIGVLVFLFGDALLAPFKPDAETARFASACLRSHSLVLPAQGAVVMMTMLTQAMGLTVRAALIASSRQGFVFIPVLLLLPRLFGQAGFILSQSVSDLLSLLLCLLLARGALTGSSCARGKCWDAQKASQSDRHS